MIRRALTSSSPRLSARALGLAAAAALLAMLTSPARAQELAFPGGVIWQVTLTPPPLQLPAFDDQCAYVVLEGGEVRAIDHAAGTTRWTARAASTVRPASSGRFLVGADGPKVWAIDTDSGAIAWTHDVGAPVSAIGAATSAGAALLVASRDLVLLAWADGHEAWRVRLPAEVSAPLAAAPDRLFAGLEDGQVLAIALQDGASLWAKAPGTRVLGLTAIGDRVFAGTAENFFYALKVKDGDVSWRWRTGGDVVARAVADDRRVYFASLDAMLRALDRRHGDLRWQRPLTTRAVGDPVLADTKIILGGVAPELRAFRTSDGGQLATAPVPGRPLHGPFLAPAGPAAPRRLVLLTGGGTLLAIGQTVEPMLVPLDVIPGRKLPAEVLPEIIRR